MSTAPNGKIAHAHPVGVGHRTSAAGAHAAAPHATAPHASGPGLKVIDKPSAGAKSIAGDKAGKPAKPKITSPARRKELMVALLAAVVIVVAGVALFSYFRKSDETINTPRQRVGSGQVGWNFIASSEFDQLPFRRKRILIEDLYDHKPEIEKARVAGQVTETTYKTLLSYFWIAKKWKEIDKYAAKSPQEKREYMAKLVDDELTPGLTVKPAVIENAKRDKSETKGIMERFPAEEKQKINDFKEQLDEAIKWQKRENQKIAAAAKAAATRPTEHKPPAVKPTDPKPAGGAGATVTAPKVK
jgi:hypothetical protein